MRKKIAAGNWKMNGTRKDLSELFAIAGNEAETAEVIICPPYTLLFEASSACQGTNVSIGGQNAHAEPSGAFTGEVSMYMLRDMGATHVILGHSERRALFGETNEMVQAKAAAAHAEGLIAIICVGETLEERETGRAIAVVNEQVKGSIPASANDENTIIAYEPVWAIGTGQVASNNDIAEIHKFIREIIPHPDKMRILYGGSVKPDNAEEIFAIDNVDGGLVGGASLKAKDFLPIIHAADK